MATALSLKGGPGVYMEERIIYSHIYLIYLKNENLKKGKPFDMITLDRIWFQHPWVEGLHLLTSTV